MIYTIKKDTNNDTRFRIPDVFSGKFKKTWKVSLAPNCWYPKELGYNQINKLVGVTEFWSANNKNSVMVGWDPCYLPEEEILEKYPHCKNLGASLTEVKYFNIYHYTNNARGDHFAPHVTVIADWRVNDLTLDLERTDSMSVDLKVIQFNPGTKETGPKMISEYPVHEVGKHFSPYLKGMLREIFLWFGGTRKAPWDMQFKVN